MDIRLASTEGTDIVGESILWSPAEACLWWIDIPARRLRRLEPASGAQSDYELPQLPGFLALAEPGFLLIGLESAIALFDIAAGRIARSRSLRNVEPHRRTNDSTVTASGDLVFGVMPSGDRSGREGEFRLLRDPDSAIETDLYVPNGLAASPDGRRIYFGETWPAVQAIWTRDFDPDTGRFGPPVPFATTHAVTGRPDGATVDAEGGYWLAAVIGGELLRFAADGSIDRRIAIPASHPTKLCFGGPELSTIYVTTVGPRHERLQVTGEMSGGVIAIEAGVRGVAEHRARIDSTEFI